MNNKFVTVTFTVKSNMDNVELKDHYRGHLIDAGCPSDDLTIEVEDVAV